MLTGVARLRTLTIGLLTAGITASRLSSAQTTDNSKPVPAPSTSADGAPSKAPAAANPEPASPGGSPASSAAPADASPARAVETPVTATPTLARPEGAPPSPANSEPEKGPKFTLGAGTILWFYQPLAGEGKNNVEVFWANLVADGSLNSFGFHLEPRFRDSKLRPFFAATAWLQEAYGYGDIPTGKIKVGKIYSRLGLFWDNSFYGNVQAYDGLKLAPNYGISAEGTIGDKTKSGLNYWAQYFVVDGGTNVSLQGRDTLSIPGSRRRNEAILHVEPFTALGEHAQLKVGVSGSYLQADLPDGKHDVYRGAADATVSSGGLSLWGEVLHQEGATVSDFPIAGVPATATTPAVAGHSSAKNNYVSRRAIQLRPVHPSVQLQRGAHTEQSVKERMHVPALQVNANDNVSLLTEVVFWDHSTPTGTTWVDRSLNVTLYAHF